MHGWWYRNIVEPGKLPLALCLVTFVVTFLITRTITRMIRAGRGPFRDQVTKGGTHIHHDIPGLVLLIIGAFTAIGPGTRWDTVAAVMIGIGVALVLDEFALIFHLKDDYWSQQGRLSVYLVILTAACLGLVLLGLSPFGVDDVGGIELAARFGAVGVLVVHYTFVVTCVLKGKYPTALLGSFVPMSTVVPAIRLARPNSIWFRRRYDAHRQEEATHRAADFDRRVGPLLRGIGDVIAGRTSTPN